MVCEKPNNFLSHISSNFFLHFFLDRIAHFFGVRMELLPVAWGRHSEANVTNICTNSFKQHNLTKPWS